jgi:hypothetical protein
MTPEQKDEAILKLKAAIPTDTIRGPTGPRGPSGADATTNPTELVSAFKNDTVAMGSLATKIATDNTTTLGERITGEFSKETTSATALRTQLATTLATSGNFQTAIANLLTTNSTYKDRIKGDTGSVASDAALQLQLQPKTLWCADGTMCDIPTGKQGIKFGAGASSIYDNNNLNIRTTNNIFIENKNLKGYKLVGDQNIITGKLHVDGDLGVGQALQLPGNWNINSAQSRFYIGTTNVPNLITLQDDRNIYGFNELHTNTIHLPNRFSIETQPDRFYVRWAPPNAGPRRIFQINSDGNFARL